MGEVRGLRDFRNRPFQYYTEISPYETKAQQCDQGLRFRYDLDRPIREAGTAQLIKGILTGNLFGEFVHTDRETIQRDTNRLLWLQAARAAENRPR